MSVREITWVGNFIYLSLSLVLHLLAVVFLNFGVTFLSEPIYLLLDFEICVSLTLCFGLEWKGTRKMA